MKSRVECRKFIPNIFDQRKCSQCFRSEEDHSDRALEYSRSLIKIIKCGYLFVAPDWDFDNPLYRKKRWQRRWFILYSNGKLAYAIDDQIDTVPQAVIDLSMVVNIVNAEDLTGHMHSICILAMNTKTFLKGTQAEEIKWWFKEMSRFITAKDGKIEYISLTSKQDNKTQYYETTNITENSEKGVEKKENVLGPSSPKSNKNIFERSKSSEDIVVSIDETDSCMANHTRYEATAERGDPDGDCGVDKSNNLNINKYFEFKTSNDYQELTKKGWLCKKDTRTFSWSKHWFCLAGSALFYYRDMVAEQQGVLDGVLDVNCITNIKEVSAGNNFGFKVTMWDNRSIILAASTSSIRADWMKQIQKVGGRNIQIYDSQLFANVPIPTEQTFAEKEDSCKNTRASQLSNDQNISKPTFSSFIKKEKTKTNASSKNDPSTVFTVYKNYYCSPSNCHVSSLDKTKETLNSTINDLQFKLREAENELNTLKANIQQKDQHIIKLNNSLEKLKADLNLKNHIIEKEHEHFEAKLQESSKNTQQTINYLNLELVKCCEKIKMLQNRKDRNQLLQHRSLSVDSLNDLLYTCSVNPIEIDSLTNEYNQLKLRYEKTVIELRALRKELNVAYHKYDTLEIHYMTLKLEIERIKYDEESRQIMTAERIEDLTNKYTAAERTVRNLKSKLSKSDRRRSTGQESLLKEVSLNDIRELIPVKARADNENVLVEDNQRMECLDGQNTVMLCDFLYQLECLEKKINLNFECINREVDRIEWLLQCDTSHNRQHIIDGLSSINDIIISLKNNENLKPKCQSELPLCVKNSVEEAVNNLISKLKCLILEYLNGREVLVQNGELSHENHMNLLTARLSQEISCFENFWNNILSIDYYKKLAQSRALLELENTLASTCSKLRQDTNNFTNNGIKSSLIHKLVEHVPMVCDILKEVDIKCLLSKYESLVMSFKDEDLKLLVYQLAIQNNFVFHNDATSPTIQKIFNLASEKIKNFVITYETENLISFYIGHIGNIFKNDSFIIYHAKNAHKLSLMMDQCTKVLEEEVNKWKPKFQEYYKLICTTDQWRYQQYKTSSNVDIKDLLSELVDIISVKSLMEVQARNSKNNVALQTYYSTLNKSKSINERSLNLQNSIFDDILHTLMELDEIMLDITVLFNQCTLDEGNSLPKETEIQSIFKKCTTILSSLKQLAIVMKIDKEKNNSKLLNKECALLDSKKINGTKDKEIHKTPTVETCCTKMLPSAENFSNNDLLCKQIIDESHESGCEIDNIKSLCQKRMAIMEASHNKVLQTLKDNHYKEIQQLQAEKEQALAEETKATLAALDAMQKAHKNEVQREILRFKHDFYKKYRMEINAISDTEKSKLSDVRQEILSLSEKYSEKCVEVASLKEQLEASNKRVYMLEKILEESEKP